MFKTDDFWRNVSSFWSFYEDRSQHNAIWDAFLKVSDSFGVKANQAFYSKSLHDVFTDGYASGFLNDFVKEEFFHVSKFSGNAKKMQVPGDIKDYLPIFKGTANAWISDGQDSIKAQIPKSDFYIDNLNSSLEREFFEEKNILPTTANAKLFSVGDFILSIAGHHCHILKKNENNDLISEIFSFDIKDTSNDNIEEVFSVVRREDFLFFACGEDGVIVYQVDEINTTATRVNPESNFGNIENIIISGNTLYLSSGPGSASDPMQNHGIYVVDASFPQLVFNNPNVLIEIIATQQDRDYPAKKIVFLRNNLFVFLSDGGGIEQYDVSQTGSSNYVGAFEGKFSSPINGASLSNVYLQTTYSTAVVTFLSGTTEFAFLYDWRSPSSPQRLNSDAVILGSDLLGIYISYDNQKMVVSYPHSIFFYNCSDKNKITLINEKALSSPSTSYVDHLSHFYAYSESGGDVVFLSADFGHSGESLQGFNNLIEIDPIFFTEVNKNLYSEIENNGFENFEWSLTYDDLEDLYIFEIVDFSYEINGTPREKLMGDDLLLFSSIMGEGNYVRITNNGTDQINIGGNNYSINFFIVIKEPFFDVAGNKLQYKSYVTIDASKIEEPLLQEIRNNGISSNGIKLYNIPSPNRLVIRDGFPLPFFFPDISSMENSNQESGDYIFKRISYSSGNLRNSLFLVRSFSNENLFTKANDRLGLQSFQDTAYCGFDPEEELKAIVGGDVVYGRYDVLAIGKDFCVLKLHSYNAQSDEGNFETLFRSKAQVKFFMDPIQPDKFFSKASNSKIEISEASGSSILSVLSEHNVENMIGLIISVGNSLTDDEGDQFLIVEAENNHETHGKYIRAIKYLSPTIETYVPQTSQTTEFNLWDFGVYESLESFALCDSNAQIRTQNSYKPQYDLFLSYFKMDLGFSNLGERKFSIVNELWSEVLPEITGVNRIYQIYDDSKPEEHLNKFTTHDGKIVFANKPEDEWLWAPYAFENLSVLSKVFAPLVGASESEFDSQAFKTNIQALFYMYAHGPNVETIEIGLNVFGGNPCSIYKEAIVRDISDGVSVTVEDDDGDQTIISLNGEFVKKSIYVGKRLKPFESLVTSVEVKDEVNHPRWWNTDYIALLTPYSQYKEDIKINGMTPNQRIVMNEILKHNVFGVGIDAKILQQGGSEVIRSIRQFMDDLKPAYMFGILYSKLFLGEGEDDMQISDSILLDFRLRINSTLFNNYRNKFFSSDDLENEEEYMSMGRQNSFQTFEDVLIYYGNGVNAEKYCTEDPEFKFVSDTVANIESGDFFND